VIWEGFPFFLNGSTDSCRTYHPHSVSVCSHETEREFEFVFRTIKTSLAKLFDYEYQPNVLVTDGAEAITNGFMKAFDYLSLEEFIRVMCWSHVDRAYKPKMSKIEKEFQKQIEHDINKLQISASDKIFEKGVDLFYEKWSNINAEIDTFLAYFRKEWIDSSTCKWYEGAAIFAPSHNNGCEGSNRWIKETHTKRRTLSISGFLDCMFKMVRNWSEDRVKNKIFQFHSSIKIKPETWKMVYAFLYVNNGNIFKIKSTNSYKLTRGDKSLSKKKQLDIDNFDDFIEYSDNVSMVNFNSQEWSKSTCSCWYFNKKYNCHHVLIIAANNKLTDIPNQYRNVPIMQKNKPGRKKKVKAGDALKI
jgi:hypothetical protein